MQQVTMQHRMQHNHTAQPRSTDQPKHNWRLCQSLRSHFLSRRFMPHRAREDGQHRLQFALQTTGRSDQNCCQCHGTTTHIRGGSGGKQRMSAGVIMRPPPSRVLGLVHWGRGGLGGPLLPLRWWGRGGDRARARPISYDVQQVLNLGVR